MTAWNIETALNHHAGCSVYDDGACTCGFRARREQIERSPLAPGEGTWSVFAQKVVEERDALKEVVHTLKARLVDAEQKLLNAECERDASRGMEKAAEMRAERLYKERERLTECNDRELFIESKRNRLAGAIQKWFAHQEYVTIEIDVEAGTATVLPRKT